MISMRVPEFLSKALSQEERDFSRVFLIGTLTDTHGKADKYGLIWLYSNAAHEGYCSDPLSQRILLEDLVLDKADFSRVSFMGFDMPGIRAAKAALNKSLFARCCMESAYMAGSDLEGAILDYTSASGSNFRDCRMGNASFMEAEMYASRFWRADLRNTDASDSDFNNSSFKGAAMDGMKMKGSDLSYANLTGATGLETANLEGARFWKTKVSRSQRSVIYPRIGMYNYFDVVENE